MTKDIQAKDIADQTILSLVECGVGFRSDIQDALAGCDPPLPPKVVLAKLRAMVKRGLLEGCACGCRGDFRLKS